MAEHELENLLLLHSDICGFLVSDVPLAHLSTRDRAEIEQTLKGLSRRFFTPAVLKYAALHLGHRGSPYPLVAVRRLLNKTTSPKSIRTALHDDIVNSGLDWDTFRDQVLAIIRALRRRFHDENLSREARSLHLLRLSDGKCVMTGMKHDYHAANAIEGHLIDRLVESTYASVFRGEILAVVGI